MSFKLAEAFVQLGVRQGGLKSGLSTAKNFIMRSFSGLGAAVGVSFGIAGAVGLSAFVVRAAASAEEIQSKFEAVFKELTGNATSFSREFAKSIGRSVVEVKKSMSEFQDVLVPLGFSRKESLELSKTMQGLAIDLASFNNKSDEQAAQAVRKALLGEREMMKELGVAILESDVKLKLMEKGQAKLTGTALKQAKVLATLELIQQLSTDAQGDALRTSGSFTNQMKRLTGAMSDLGVAIGNIVLPELTKMVSLMADAVSGTETFFTDINRVVQDFRMLFSLEFGGAFNDLIDWFKILRVNWAMSMQVMKNDMGILLEEVFVLGKNLGTLFQMLADPFSGATLQSIADLATGAGQTDRAKALATANQKLTEAMVLQSAQMRTRFAQERKDALRRRLLGGAGGKGGGGAGGTQPTQLSSGFFGFEQLAKKIQEQTLKTSKPQERMVGLMEGDRMVQQRQERALNRIVAGVDRIGAVGAGAPSLVAESAR